MFGGGGAGNPLFPGFVEENLVPFDNHASPQLQLFGHAPSHLGGSINLTGNLHASVYNVGIKRLGDGVPVCMQQKLQFTSTKNNSLEEFGPIPTSTLPNPNFVSTGLRLSCEEEEHKSSVTSAGENKRSTIPGGCLKMVVDQQTGELEQYIKLQDEKILNGLRKLNQRHTVTLLNALEETITRKLNEKELELENINRKNKELGDKIKQVSMEAQSWHYRAKYGESMVNALKCNIQQLMAQGTSQAREGSGDSEMDDAMSATNLQCISRSGSQVYQNDRLKCKSCRSKEVTFLLIPCRHLCLCSDCERFTSLCPVCRVMKTGSVHVYM